MLNIYRRHGPNCKHADKGRSYRRCNCPIWAEGTTEQGFIRNSMKTRNWDKAQKQIRDWDLNGFESDDLVTIGDAIEGFKADASARGLAAGTLKKYRVMFDQLTSYCAGVGIAFVSQLNLDHGRKFRESWKDAALAASKKLERFRGFIRFCVASKWIAEDFSRQIKAPKIRQSPTLPFTREEMTSIISSCEGCPDARFRSRLRAFVLLQRYSGLRMEDVATMERTRIQGDKLLLYTSKTGQPVNVILPGAVVQAVDTMPPVSIRYLFWTGKGTIDTLTGNWRRALKRVFVRAGIKGGHSHRFRDTFAVELLLAGTPIEEVAVLLGHSSTKITERHYSPWVKARQVRLEGSLQRAWASDPLLSDIGSTNVTKNVQ